MDIWVELKDIPIDDIPSDNVLIIHYHRDSDLM